MITTICKISYGSQTVPPIVPAVQGDTGRAISFEIADFTPPAGATATYFILKPSGEAIYNSATITDNSILCELTAQSLAEAGENRMQVRVLKGEDIVTSFEVILMVRTFLGDDAIESGTEMNIFDQAVEQATEQFQENAEQIVEEVIEYIPADYTELTEEVSELNERLGSLEDLSSAQISVWEQGTAYANSTTNKIIRSASDSRCRNIPQEINPNIKVITAKDGYLFKVYCCSKNGSDYYSEVEPSIPFAKSIDVTEYSGSYYIVIVASKTDNSAITPEEAQANIIYQSEIITTIKEISEEVNTLGNTVTEQGNNINDLNDVIMKEAIDPAETQNNKCYYASNNSVISVADGVVEKVIYDDEIEYYVSTSLTASSTGFPLLAFFDSSNTLISTAYANSANVEISITNQKITVPENTAWFYINGRNTTIDIYTLAKPNVTLSEIAEKVGEKEISILFVGNSLTQDGIAYLPYVLKTYYPKIKFKFYMWYNGGYTLAEHYQKFINNENCQIFSIAENTVNWTNTNKTMLSILETYNFDIVCMQEYFNYKESYDSSDLVDWNNCQEYIRSHYTGGNGLEFISLFHAPLRSSATDVFNLTKTGNAIILQNTVADNMLANGIAVYRALSTALDNLGDMGHLSPDGTHTQEGLPCLLQTYVTLLWILDRLAMPTSIYGLPMKMTTAIYNTLSVPGPNLGTGVIEGTDAENILAQEVAIKAYKEGKQFVIDNLFSQT